MNPTSSLPLSPLLERLSACLDHIESMDVLLGDLEPMSPDESRRSLRLPLRGAAIVPAIADVCRELAIDEVGEMSLHQMRGDLEDAARIRLVLERFRLVLARLEAHRARSETSGWRAALTFYGVLRRIARHDEHVGARLKPIVGFFGRRGRRP